MKRLLPLVLLAFAPPVAPKAAAPPLTITRDERAMLLGFDGRARAIRLQAERELAEIAGEQREYLGRVAGRLGLDPIKLMNDYTVNLDTLVVAPKPKAAP